MSYTRLDKLVALLKKLFQLDRPDLDFGFYRIMHAKRTEVTRFLEQDLLPTVQHAFSNYGAEELVRLERELQLAVQQAMGLGTDPGTVPKVRELKVRIGALAESSTALENDVYDHLYRFFRRYYSDGDFISKRVYKEGVYAIPYEGEEVKLHWANADQYYIKTEDYPRNYTFRLCPDDDDDPMRVHFRVTDAAQGEHGNVRPSKETTRVFVLPTNDFVTEDNGELVICFEYRPATTSDWGDNHNVRPPKQRHLVDIAEAHILREINTEPLFRWIQPLAASHTLSDGTEAKYTRLRAHLTQYTARNTFDYFIHKDLGAFLRRELDFYIKNDVVHLDDIENEDAPRVEQYLAKVKVIRVLARKVIAFLEQLEDFQKRLWTKKKFAVDTSWCVRLDCIPETFYVEIAANERQRQEWVDICSSDKAGGELPISNNDPSTTDFLKNHPTLMVDTKHFSTNFTSRLLEALVSLDDQTDGVLVHGENFQALQLMQERYRNSIDCIYIDPPYNSKTSEIAYKNTYKHSSWMSLMSDRLALSRRLALKGHGCHIIAIDENEQERLGFLLSAHFPNDDKICVSIVHNKKGIQGTHFSYSHDLCYFLIPIGRTRINRIPIPKRKWKYTNLRTWGNESKRHTARNCFYPIYVQNNEIVGFGNVCADDEHPAGANVDRSNGCMYVYPIDQNGVERKWRYARDTVESIKGLLRVHHNDTTGEIQIQKAQDVRMAKTVWHHSKYIAGDHGTKWLKFLGLASREPIYPKSIHTVGDSIGLVTDTGSVVLDYFAGSGTTGHAVVNLNRGDGGRRRFVLVEMGDHFDTILLPRLKKVTYTPEWKDGRPKRQATPEEAERSPRLFKVIRLESYEDTLNNLVDGNPGRRELWGTDTSAGFREEYLLRYMLDVETRGSPSLLDIEQFIDPVAYRLKIKVPGSDETREVAVDLLETFNWLLGLKVERLRAPRYFNARFCRNSEDRLCLDGTLEPTDDGRWWLRVVEGQLPDQRKAVIIWRNRPGGDDPKGVERDNLVLDEFFGSQGYGGGEYGLDVVYANGDHNLGNLRAEDSAWSACMVEGHFRRLMFEREGIRK